MALQPDEPPSGPDNLDSTFPFFNLPRELRDQIYIAVITSRPIHIRKHRRIPAHCYGILLANKQTYAEALPLYYTSATFIVEETWARIGVEWLAALPEQYRDWIAKLVFQRDLGSLGNMYSKIVYRAVSEQRQQAMLLEPFLRELDCRGIELREGVVRSV